MLLIGKLINKYDGYSQISYITWNQYDTKQPKTEQKAKKAIQPMDEIGTHH